MDEDDSQDELINRSSSHSKGKRAALWAISDDSDDLEEESEEGESDSGDEEEECDVNGDEEDGNEEEDDEEEEEEEEEDAKPENGAFGGTSADLEGMSSDEDRERCPICLNSFSSQPVATPENCEHYFCFDCILEWAKNANSCPVDRIAFNSIYLRKCYGGKVKKMITVQKPVKAGQEETVDLDLEQTNCEVCGGSDREDRLLLCDGCDAGYHMECLTPPLDSVPVEEWFCPECEANNRHSRGSAVELSETDSLSSPARPATSRAQTRAVGPTRAIARTQQSERVRANVNRHRITQLAPTYLIQSTWLDETINAVVAGLNTAVYVRDITPRAPLRRRTRKRRRVKRKKTSSAKGPKGQVESTGIKRKKRRARRSKSKKKQIVKRSVTPRGRIANNLGIVKDKKSSSLPTVYRPSEHTLSNMRADIGAASLSIYGDPFDLDPFVEHEEEDDQEATVTSLLEAKRRGISRSALRSHQPVARPVTASLSRRSADVSHSGSVVEAAPVPDLLGSILSGQSILLMDSSDVVINRDGSLKASTPMMLPSRRKSSSSGDVSALGSPGFSSNMGDDSTSPHHDGSLPGSSHSSVNGLLTQNSFPPASFMPHSANPSKPTPHSNLSPRRNLGLLPPCPNRPTSTPHLHDANGVRSSRETSSSSVHPIQDTNFKSKGVTPSQSQPKKAPVKPMWVDVSVLPRIPKIKRESSNITNDGTSHGGSYGSNRVIGSTGNSSSSSGASSGSGLPEGSMNNFSGDKGRQQSVDQQKSRSDSQAQRNRPDRASSSSAFSNSFSSSSSSSSSSGTSASQPQHALFSSSSSVSFRINSSGNSWHAKRLNIKSSSSTGSNIKEKWRKKEEEIKKKQLHKDKQKLLKSHAVSEEQDDDNNIYDPFNPTLSDSSSSGDEAESPGLYRSPLHATHEGRGRISETKDSVPNKRDLVHVKPETQETELSQEAPGTSLNAVSQKRKFSEHRVKVEEESEWVDVNTEKQAASPDTNIKQEPSSDESEKDESEGHDGRIKSGSEIKSEMTSITPPVQQSIDQINMDLKAEGESGHDSEAPSSSPLKYRDDSSASSSTTTKKRQQEHIKSDFASCSKSPTRDLDHKKQTSKASKEQQSSSSETDRGRRDDLSHEDHQGSEKRSKKKEKDKDRSSRRSRSKERRNSHSTSDSSQSNSPDRTQRRRRWSRSRSADKTRKRRSRSRSSSSSRERSRMNKHNQRSKERTDHRERDYERRHTKDSKRGASRSKSRSRSRERRKEPTRHQHTTVSSRDKVQSRSKDKKRQRSRSRSRERRKEGSSRSTEKSLNTRVSSSRDTNRSQERKKESSVTQRSTEEAKRAEVNKQDLPSSFFTSHVKKERSDCDADSQTRVMENPKQIKTEKEKIKSESVDMFEDSLVTKPVKSEEDDSMDETLEDPNKTESNIKSEPSPSVPPSSTLTTLVTADILEDTVPQSEPVSTDSDKEPNTTGLTAPIKQEPSDSDDDFNVDVMLDNLDYMKAEQTECSGAAAKEEKEAVEEKEEEEPVSTVVGSKSKTQVKRVTWNIQEPEGPQPEKSPSKLALYKLKLKQEGSRKLSLAAQAAGQDIAGAASDLSKKSAVSLPGNSTSSGALQPGELSATGQEEAEEGDLSRKDKYLKKLHMQERAVEEVKLAIKPFYQKRDINKEEYKEILRKAVQKVCHSKSGEINPVKVGNLIKAYVEKYKHARKHKKGEDSVKVHGEQTEPMDISDSP
ncbi:PHD and RING finger domain-containing protein 1 isoform X2 [Kryptolebias marmoratus]|uniref:PHD and RING finger domain-containing protein 1 isoform X2 n=1 Tax=Kryptolebias marmoratus TaxID=37003 RepID=UPI0007F91429|nr:PHD and RING finger domain-containing protein 1 isoform X2 [Kryptolebias marmoratus]